MTDRKKPGAAFWAAVVLSLVLLYVAGFGPASCFANRNLAVYPWFAAIYWPIGWVAVNSPVSVNKAIRRYAKIGRKRDGIVIMPTSFRGDCTHP